MATDDGYIPSGFTVIPFDPEGKYVISTSEPWDSGDLERFKKIFLDWLKDENDPVLFVAGFEFTKVK